MNHKEYQAQVERVFADTARAYERSRGPWGFARQLGAFIVGGVVTAGMVAGFAVLLIHLHPK
ncbi:hypothetical protein [Paraburkholderia sp.]|uniref:hypothetical protein n=1 Tax=Paraburkholderia sp. TaxID=1926495 RepID=UPI0023831975|nr:hypothetical protein [Paraburkholderia sp.]MDE1183581.1 hypothetical protein [Paraburkholderia sp.]